MIAVTDPVAALTAADAFASKFPQSELRYALYSQLLQKFYAADNRDKVIETGKKLLAIEPVDAMALIMVATATAESTHDTDLDAEEKYTLFSTMAWRTYSRLCPHKARYLYRMSGIGFRSSLMSIERLRPAT